MNRDMNSKIGVVLLAVAGSFFVVSSVLGRDGDEQSQLQRIEVAPTPAQQGWRVLGGSRGWQGAPVPARSEALPVAPVYPEINQNGAQGNPWALRPRAERTTPRVTNNRPWGSLPPEGERGQNSSAPQVQRGYRVVPSPAYGYQSGSGWQAPDYGYNNFGGANPYSGGWGGGYPNGGNEMTPWNGSGSGFPWGGSGGWPMVDFF